MPACRCGVHVYAPVTGTAAEGTTLWPLDEALGPARVRNGQSQRWHDDSGTPFRVSRLCLHVCVYVHARGGGGEGVCVYVALCHLA